MKNLYKLLLVVAISLSFASCQQEMNAPDITSNVHFILNANMAETKTGIIYDDGSYLPYWQNGDQLGILLSIPEAGGNISNDAVFANTQSDGEKASFEGDITHADGVGITFYSYYPASSGKKVYYSAGVTTFGLDVKNPQVPAYHATNGYS